MKAECEFFFFRGQFCPPSHSHFRFRRVKNITTMDSSPPSPPLVSPSGAQACACDVDASSARPSSARYKDDDDDDVLSKPPFLDNIDDDDDDNASTSSTSTMTTEAAAAAAAAAAEPPPPPISRLPEEMLSCIFAFLPPAAVGRASCVCSAWREAAVGYDATIWREALSKALGSRALAEAARRALAESTPSSSSSSYSPSASLSATAAAAVEEGNPPPPLQPTWRQTFLATPAPRCDGFYVSRETYIRTGITEWTVRNPVHVVVYFRYYRFFPPREAGEEAEDGEGASVKPPRGRFWYRTTPDAPAKAARSLALGPPRASASSSSSSSSSASDKSTVVEGRYRLGGGARGKGRVDPAMLRTAWRVRNSAGTEVRAKLRLRSCEGKEGAWDRMDVVALASHDLASGLTLPFTTQPQQDEEDGGRGGGGGGLPSATPRRGGRQQQAPRAPPPLAHQRGLSTFVFVPWGGVEDTPLNLPLSQMDCWIPG